MKARRLRNFATALSVAALLPAGAAFAETTLRDGLKFHNGAPVTAEDCIASIQRWAQRDAMGKRMAKHVETMTATGDTSFEIKLSSKFGALIDGFAKPSSLPLFIMPADIAATPASEQIKTYVGSGPFKFVADDFQPGVKAVYEKNADYVPRAEPASGLAGGKIVKVDRVEYLSFPDSQTVVNALKQGEVDMVVSVTPDMAKQRQLGFAMLFVTHDLRVAARLCDRIMVMQHGRCVEIGPPQEVLRHPSASYTRELLGALPGQAMHL